jgi:hypothetical protein
MRVNWKLSFLLRFAFASLWVPTVYPYLDNTHASISHSAYLDAHNIQANFFNALGIQDGFAIGDSVPRLAQDWLERGSVKEDNDPLVNTTRSFVFPNGIQYPQARVLYHFFDPLAPPASSTFLRGGLSFSSPYCFAEMSPSWVWAVGGNGSGSGLLQNTPVGDINFNLSSYSDFPWSRTNLSGSDRGALFYFLQGLTSGDAKEFGLMFLSLGHVIHLLQDAAQPQHVRNDAHLNPSGYLGLPAQLLCGSTPSAYEKYVESNYPTNPQWFTGYAPPAGSQFVSPVSFFGGIAEFANSNFVSRGTNCTIPPTASCSLLSPCDCGSHTSATSGYFLDYPQPKFSGPPVSIQHGVGEITFYQNTVTDNYTGTKTQNPRMTSSSIFDLDLMEVGAPPKFTLNQLNYASQAAILLPVAEGYSAGLLNYFFRGSLTAGGNSMGFTITNNTMNGSVSEAMDGQFSLYYDDENGNRNPSGSWRISIPGGQTVSTDINGNPLTFTPPETFGNRPPRTPGQYILVFNGHLGIDPFGLVAGAIVTIPSVIPPPQ